MSPVAVGRSVFKEISPSARGPVDSQIELASGECVDSIRDAERIKKTWLQPGAALSLGGLLFTVVEG